LQPDKGFFQKVRLTLILKIVIISKLSPKELMILKGFRGSRGPTKGGFTLRSNKGSSDSPPNGRIKMLKIKKR